MISWPIKQQQGITQQDIVEEMALDQRRGRLSVIEQRTKLYPEEDERISNWLRGLPFEAELISIKRMVSNITYNGMVIRKVHSTRFIVKVISERNHDMSLDPPLGFGGFGREPLRNASLENGLFGSVPAGNAPLGNAPLGNGLFGSVPQGNGLFGNALSLSRPTYIKVHRKHIEPETLNFYKLPWEGDDVSLTTQVLSVG